MYPDDSPSIRLLLPSWINSDRQPPQRRSHRHVLDIRRRSEIFERKTLHFVLSIAEEKHSCSSCRDAEVLRANGHRQEKFVSVGDVRQGLFSNRGVCVVEESRDILRQKELWLGFGHYPKEVHE